MIEKTVETTIGVPSENALPTNPNSSGIIPPRGS